VEKFGEKRRSTTKQAQAQQQQHMPAHTQESHSDDDSIWLVESQE
jgi:hypothetical protein